MHRTDKPRLQPFTVPEKAPPLRGCRLASPRTTPRALVQSPERPSSRTSGVDWESLSPAAGRMGRHLAGRLPHLGAGQSIDLS